MSLYTMTVSHAVGNVQCSTNTRKIASPDQHDGNVDGIIHSNNRNPHNYWQKLLF